MEGDNDGCGGCNSTPSTGSDSSGTSGTSSGSSSNSTASTGSHTSEAVKKAKSAEQKAKEMVAKVGRELVKFIADELGITDAIDCFTQGDIEGCVNTALNIVASVVGGAAGKLIARYAFRANKLVAAIKRGKSLAGQLFNALGEYKKSRKAVEEATSCIFHSFVAGTLVLMADGSFKPIDEIDVGD